MESGQLEPEYEMHQFRHQIVVLVLQGMLTHLADGLLQAVLLEATPGNDMNSINMGMIKGNDPMYLHLQIVSDE